MITVAAAAVKYAVPKRNESKWNGLLKYGKNGIRKMRAAERKLKITWYYCKWINKYIYFLNLCKINFRTKNIDWLNKIDKMIQQQTTIYEKYTKVRV